MNESGSVNFDNDVICRFSRRARTLIVAVIAALSSSNPTHCTMTQSILLLFRRRLVVPRGVASQLAMLLTTHAIIASSRSSKIFLTNRGAKVANALR